MLQKEKKKRKKVKSKKMPTLGWREWVRLPDLGISHIKAKIDTGARTSAIHTLHIRTEERDGQEWVRFKVYPAQKQKHPEVECLARVVDRRFVKNSGGKREKRPVIETHLAVGDEEWPVEITLTNRSIMGFRMLLGRAAIRRKWLVDPGKSYIASSKPNALSALAKSSSQDSDKETS